MLYAVKTSKCDGIYIVSFNLAYNFEQRSAKSFKIVLRCLTGDLNTSMKYEKYGFAGATNYTSIW